MINDPARILIETEEKAYLIAMDRLEQQFKDDKTYWDSREEIPPGLFNKLTRDRTNARVFIDSTEKYIEAIFEMIRIYAGPAMKEHGDVKGQLRQTRIENERLIFRLQVLGQTSQDIQDAIHHSRPDIDRRYFNV